MTLYPWQKRFLRGLVRPGVRTAALSMARSNGKSWMAAKVCRDYLMGERRDSEALIVAHDLRQAKVILKYVAGILRAEGHDLTDRARWTHRDSVTQGLIRDLSTGQAVRAMSGNPKSLHGRVFGLCCIDEPREHERGQRDDLLAAVTTGMGKVGGSRVIALGTMPDDSAHWFARWCGGEADYVQVHRAPPDAPPFQLKTVRQANPSYDHLPALREDLLARRKKARKYPDVFDEWKSRHLNMGTEDRSSSRLAERAYWEGIEGEARAAGPTVWGIDLGGADTQSAVACYWPHTGRLEALAVFPGLLSDGRPGLAARARADGVGNLYEDMRREGSLLLTEGRRVTDIGQLLREAWERWGRPHGLAADLWRISELQDSCEGLSLPAPQLRRQGFKDGSEDVRAFQRLALDGRVTPVRSALLRHAILEARLVHDTAGNVKLASGTEGGKRRRGRDDAAVAAVLAVALGARVPPRPAKPRPTYILGQKAPPGHDNPNIVYIPP